MLNRHRLTGNVHPVLSLPCVAEQKQPGQMFQICLNRDYSHLQFTPISLTLSAWRYGPKDAPDLFHLGPLWIMYVPSLDKMFPYSSLAKAASHFQSWSAKPRLEFSKGLGNCVYAAKILGTWLLFVSRRRRTASLAHFFATGGKKSKLMKNVARLRSPLKMPFPAAHSSNLFWDTWSFSFGRPVAGALHHHHNSPPSWSLLR